MFLVMESGKSANCKHCKKIIQLSNIVEGVLMSHTGRDKHRKKIADLKDYKEN